MLLWLGGGTGEQVFFVPFFYYIPFPLSPLAFFVSFWFFVFCFFVVLGGGFPFSHPLLVRLYVWLDGWMVSWFLGLPRLVVLLVLFLRGRGGAPREQEGARGSKREHGGAWGSREGALPGSAKAELEVAAFELDSVAYFTINQMIRCLLQH